MSRLLSEKHIPNQDRGALTMTTASIGSSFGLDPDERAPIEGADRDGWGGPLDDSAHWGRLAIARTLLKRGADPNPKPHLSTTPIARAYENRDAAMIELLERYGALTHPVSVGSRAILRDPTSGVPNLQFAARLSSLVVDALASIIPLARMPQACVAPLQSGRKPLLRPHHSVAFATAVLERREATVRCSTCRLQNNCGSAVKPPRNSLCRFPHSVQ